MFCYLFEILFRISLLNFFLPRSFVYVLQVQYLIVGTHIWVKATNIIIINSPDKSPSEINALTIRSSPVLCYHLLYSSAIGHFFSRFIVRTIFLHKRCIYYNSLVCHYSHFITSLNDRSKNQDKLPIHLFKKKYRCMSPVFCILAQPSLDIIGFFSFTSIKN